MLKGQLGCAGCLGGLEVASVPARGGNVSRGSATTQMSLSLGTSYQDTCAPFPASPTPYGAVGTP